MIIYLSMFFTKKVLEASNRTIQAYVRIESVHEGNKLFKCNDCGPGFSLKIMKGLDTVKSLSAGAVWDPIFLP